MSRTTTTSFGLKTDQPQKTSSYRRPPQKKLTRYIHRSQQSIIEIINKTSVKINHARGREKCRIVTCRIKRIVTNKLLTRGLGNTKHDLVAW